MIKTYFWPDIPNAGDLLTPPLLQRWAGIETEWAPIEQAEVIAVGSILEHVPEGWRGAILGAGRLLEDSELHLDRAKVFAVRGPLSAKGIKGDFAIGDAGLLADEMWPAETKKYDLGIVPHWSDVELAHKWPFVKYNPVIISPWKDPEWFVRTIGECRKIVTSSLHGIIIADAFGIPRRMEIAPKFKYDPHEGNMFKFKDYCASVHVPFEFGRTMTPRRGFVEACKHEIWDAYVELGRYFR